MILPIDNTTDKANACGPMERSQHEMRRFTADYATLPVETLATCPTCDKVVPAVFDRAGSQIVLTFDCPDCGQASEVHHDAIWTDLRSDRPDSPVNTWSGRRIHPVLRRIPRTVETLCPECGAILLGRYYVADGAVMIEKTCPEHGHVRDCVNTDVRLFSKASWWSFEEPPGLKEPQKPDGHRCPSDCGLCGSHLSAACLAQIDLTNRCNMRCPICFANAGTAGYVCEPSYEQIVKQLQTLRDLRPTPCSAIQFTGGEPTMHPDFLRIVSTARDMGFSYIQIATNGITMANPDFADKALAAGLHTLYLQFDGVGQEAYESTRNYPGIWEKKLAAIENCRRIGMKICLVPTIVKGVTDNQVEKIFKFAIENIDVVSGISYQPVSFTGRISSDDLSKMRYTLGDLARDIGSASGSDPLSDMYPLSIVVPLSQMIEALTGQPKIRASSHPDCAYGTYFLISPEGKPYPFPRVINVEGMFSDMNRIAGRINNRGGRVTWLDRIRVLRMFKRHFRPEAAPPGLTVKRLIRSLQGMVDKKVGRGESEKLNYKTLLCAGMHFQDRHNFDVERAKRCVILYSTPAGVFPFCTYNCGPEYRGIVEAGYVDQQNTATVGVEETSEIK
ncbi:MAG: radical SAM protein [Phycisphaerales bacterium]|jgi:7,8-dihydro-6-hydroxymethylpterin dimethyltransferase|nr:radical SAM protein [Phycisphaerales bacterium]